VGERAESCDPAAAIRESDDRIGDIIEGLPHPRGPMLGFYPKC
jgi:hypothetical protein